MEIAFMITQCDICNVICFDEVEFYYNNFKSASKNKDTNEHLLNLHVGTTAKGLRCFYFLCQIANYRNLPLDQ
jgi:hypothetical protein